MSLTARCKEFLKDWAALGSRLDDFCADAMQFNRSSSAERLLLLSAQELIQRTTAAMDVIRRSPDLAASLIMCTKVLAALASATAAALQLPQPQFANPAFNLLNSISIILTAATSLQDTSSNNRSAVNTAAVLQLTRSGLLALLPDLATSAASQLGSSMAGASTSCSSSGASSSTDSQACSSTSSGPARTGFIADVQADIVLSVMSTCCSMWPQDVCSSATANAMADQAVRLAAVAVRYVDRALQQLPAGETPDPSLSSLAVTSLIKVCQQLYVQPAYITDGHEVKEFVRPASAAAKMHKTSLLAALCCGHLMLMLPLQHGSQGGSSSNAVAGSSGPHSGRNKHNRSGGAASGSRGRGSCQAGQSSSAHITHSRPARQPTEARGSGTGPDGAAAWRLVPQYQGRLRRLLPDDQPSVQLLQEVLGLSGTTLMWGSILLHKLLPEDMDFRQQYVLMLSNCMFAMLDPLIANIEQLSMQEVAGLAHHALLAASVPLRWLGGLQQRDLVKGARAPECASRAAKCCTHALVVLSGCLEQLRWKTTEQAWLGSFCRPENNFHTAQSQWDLPPASLLQQLLAPALRAAQQAIQCCLEQHGAASSQRNSSGSASEPSGRGRSSNNPLQLQPSSQRVSDADMRHLQQTSAGLLSSLWLLLINTHLAAAINCSTEEAAAAAAAAATAAWKPYAAHFTALLEAYLRADAMGDQFRTDMVRGILQLAAPVDWTGDVVNPTVTMRPDPARHVGPLLAHATAPGVVPGSAAQVQLYSLLCSSLKLVAATTDLLSKGLCMTWISSAAAYVLYHLTAVSASVAGATAGGCVPASQGSSHAAAAAATAPAVTSHAPVEALLPWLRLLGSCLSQYAVLLPAWLVAGGLGSRMFMKDKNIDTFCEATQCMQGLLQQQGQGGQQQGRQQPVPARGTAAGQGHPGSCDAGRLASNISDTNSEDKTALSLADWLSAHGYNVVEMQQQAQNACDALASMRSKGSHPDVWKAAYTNSRPPKLVQCDDEVSKLEAAASSIGSIAIPQVCNNPRCSNMDGHNELLLVSGSSCICGGCRTASYCGRACQKKHWPLHKPVCRALAQAKAEVVAAGTVAADML